MKKIILIAASLVSFGFAANAQNATGTATQTVNLALSNALEITFTGSATNVGATVALPFTTVNDYANGVESGTQELKVRSNKNFTINVKASAANFTTTTGGVTSASSMPVSGVLNLLVASNNTAGTISNGFGSFTTLTSSPQDLITNASKGGNQTFSVKYKATPGFAYPAATYSTDVIYTATQQ